MPNPLKSDNFELRDGRPISVDEHANDIVHRQTELLVENAEATAASLRASHARFISSGPTTLREASLGITSGMVVRDPDGHAVSLVAPAASSR